MNIFIPAPKFLHCAVAMILWHVVPVSEAEHEIGIRRYCASALQRLEVGEKGHIQVVRHPRKVDLCGGHWLELNREKSTH